MVENNTLSERELEILQLVATGASNKEIARELYISVNTVKVHLRNVYEKIGVSSRTEATVFALSNNLVQIPGVITSEENAAPIQSQQQVMQLPQWVRFLGLIVAGTILAFTAWRLASGNGSPSESAEMILQETERWVGAASLSVPRTALTLVAYEEDVFAIGGETRDGIVGITESYDLLSDEWELRAEKPTAVREIDAAVVQGEIIVPGGRTQSGNPTAIVEAYLPELDTWEQRASLPEALCSYAMVAFEGRLYLFGGWNGEHYVDTGYVYHPQSDEWVMLPDMPTARSGVGAAVIRDSIHVLGGYNGTSFLDVHEVFHPDRGEASLGTWEKAEPMPMPLRNMGVESVADILHVVGGEDALGTGGTYLTKYYALREEWETVEMVPMESWWDMGMAFLETKLIISGGSVNGHASERNWIYQALYIVILPVID